MKPVLLPTDQQTVVLLPRSSSVAKTYLPIPVDHLEEEYRLRSADDGKLFREEFSVRRLRFIASMKRTLTPNFDELGKVRQISSCVSHGP